MAEYRVPTQQELDRLLYMQGMQGKSNQQIIDENLARGSTIQSLPDNFFQTASAGARRVGDYVNQAGNVQQIVNKLFPSNIGNSQRQVPIPTSFNFAPKQAPTGEVIPAGLQTQSVPVANILQAIKPADVLGISGAERTYGDIGAGKAPQPLDVVDTLGLGAGGMAAGKGLLTAGAKTARYAAPVVGEALESYAANTGLLSPLVAYHGSPAKFDKFDISKLGTGEGQQVYGHGMYFAENAKVAEGYRARLAGGTDPYTYEWKGTKFQEEGKDPVRHAVALSYHQGTNTAKRIAKIGLEDSKKGEMYALENGGEEYYKKMLEAASNIKKKDIKAKQGAFYTVDIPDESVATFISWDKPVPDSVRDRLSPISMKQFETGVSGTSGEALYKDLMFSFKQAGSDNPARDASNWLNANGVQGIKYKDAGSRNTKGGTNNFVVFDPTNVKILKRD
jgi:hypothetical protein